MERIKGDREVVKFVGSRYAGINPMRAPRESVAADNTFGIFVSDQEASELSDMGIVIGESPAGKFVPISVGHHYRYLLGTLNPPLISLAPTHIDVDALVYEWNFAGRNGVKLYVQRLWTHW